MGTVDTEKLSFNTAIASMMEFVNDAYKWENTPHEVATVFTQLLNPYAPHMAEELWERGQWPFRVRGRVAGIRRAIPGRGCRNGCRPGERQGARHHFRCARRRPGNCAGRGRGRPEYPEMDRGQRGGEAHIRPGKDLQYRRQGMKLASELANTMIPYGILHTAVGMVSSRRLSEQSTPALTKLSTGTCR